MGLYSSSEGGGFRATKRATAAPWVISGWDIYGARSVRQHTGPWDWFGLGRRCVEAKLTVAIEHIQCSITFFNDYDATAGKAKCDVLGVDLQPVCTPAHRPILGHTTRFLPGQHQSELCGRRLWSM